MLIPRLSILTSASAKWQFIATWRHLLVWQALPLFVCLTGCGREDPKASFIAFEQRFVSQLNARLNQPIIVGAEWQKTAYLFVLDGNSSHDVEKTDSVVSPYIATLKLGLRSAKWSDGSEISDGYKGLVITFALQDGKWVSKAVGIEKARSLDINAVHFDEAWKPGGVEDVTNNSFDAPLVAIIKNLAAQAQ